MLSRVYSGATVGLDGVLIEVEVDVASMGFPNLTIVGLPTKAVDESRERVRAAIVNTGFEMPDSRMTVNLAPADLPKEGSSFDLPIAVGILASSGMIERENLKKSLFVGEVSLEGMIRRVPGVLSVAICAKEKKFKNLFVPYENAQEAALIEGLKIFAVKDLKELILHLNNQVKIPPYQRSEALLTDDIYDFDFKDIRGQEQAKRALEVAAAGFHNIHLKGPPGAGKTLLARAFPSILPPLDREEMLEVFKIYSIAGLFKGGRLSLSRPFRSPHHTTSRIGLIGGGSRPAPGEISLAHRGILFLDEFPEFTRHVLESLRQPLEDGAVSISRAAGSLSFPCRFLLIAASNPCPCGYLGHPRKSCKCMPGVIIRYRKKLSGPLLDRIDIHIDVPPVEEVKLISQNDSIPSHEIRSRILKARAVQKERFGRGALYNSQLSPNEIKRFCTLTAEATDLLKQAINKLSLSARSYFKIIKIAQTISDLEAADVIESVHIAEALQYRAKEE